jgi:hypothetical protein
VQNLNLGPLDEADLKQSTLQLALGQGRRHIRGGWPADLNHDTA